MKRQPTPTAHAYVCTHRRSDGDPLGTGCGDRGEAVFERLKQLQLSGRTRMWVTRTGCMGFCPKAGASLAYVSAGRYEMFSEATPDEAAAWCLNAPSTRP